MSRCHRALRLFAVAVLFASLAAGSPARAYEKEIQSWVKDVSGKLCSPSCRRVAVVDFTDLQGNVTELGRFLAEEVSIALGSVPGLVVHDRAHLGMILREQKLDASGLVAPETMQQVGRIAGVQAFVMGSITPFKDTVRVSLKILDTGTTGLIASTGGQIEKTGAIEDLLSRGVSSPEVAVAGSSPGAAGAAPAVHQKIAPTPIETKKFIFDFKSCELSGQTINCLLLVANIGPDRSLSISRETRLVDDQGNEYAAAEVSIANENANLSQTWRIQKVLVNKVVTKVRLTFYGVLPEATGIASLRLACASNDEAFPVDYRNVSLEQQAVPKLAAAAGVIGGAGALGSLSLQEPAGLGPATAGAPGQQGILQEMSNQIQSTGRELVRRSLRKFLNKVLPVPAADPNAPAAAQNPQ